MAWVVVLVRKHYFTTHLDEIVQQELDWSTIASTLHSPTSIKESFRTLGREFISRTSSRLSESALRPGAIQTIEIKITEATEDDAGVVQEDAKGIDNDVARKPMKSNYKSLSPLAINMHRPASTLLAAPNSAIARTSTRLPSPLSPNTPLKSAASSAVHFGDELEQDLRKRVIDSQHGTTFCH